MSNNKKSKADDKEVVVVTPASTEKKPDNKNASDASSSMKKDTASQKNSKVEASDAASSNSTKKTSKSKSNNKSSNGFMYFIILIIVGVILAGAYYFWLLQQKQNKFIEQQARTLNSLQSKVKVISASVDSETQLSALHTEKLQKLGDQLLQTEAISQKAIEIVKRSRREWALSEIDYLLRMAHRRLEVARDVSGAIAALKGADSRIQELADLNLFKIRKQLAKDIAGLNAIHQADVNGISLAIDGMIVYLSGLPFKSVKEEIKVQLNEMPETEATNQEEQTFVDSVLETVKKIGDIKVHQRSIQAASSLEQQNEIEQLLRTYLLSSRLAALRFNQTQFLREVQLASEILHLHYDTNDNRVQQLQKTLNDFSALQLSPDMPEITRAWSLLQDVINKTDKKKTAKEKKVTAENAGKVQDPIIKKTQNKVPVEKKDKLVAAQKQVELKKIEPEKAAEEKEK